MSAHAGQRHAFRVSDRYECEFTMSAVGMCCEWSPDTPSDLTEAEIAAYRAARNEAIDRWVKTTGMRVMVVEL